MVYLLSRRSLIISVELVIYCWLAAYLSCADAVTSKKTNIVVLLADDLGYGDVEYQSVNPSKGARTPNLNEMAFGSSTIRFSNFHATATSCSPTRSSLLSGRTPYRECVAGANVHNMRFNQKYHDMYPFRADMGSVARSAKAAGYATAFFGKWHLGPLPQRSPGTMGFDNWVATLTNIPTYDPYCFVPELQCMKSCRWKTFRCVKVRGSKWCGSQITFNKCYYGHYPAKKPFLGGYDPRMIEPRPTASPSSPRAQVQAAAVPAQKMMADVLISKFETFAEGVPLSQPIFAYIWFYEPHVPFLGSPELNALCLNGTTCKGRYSSSIVTEEIDYFSAVVAIDRAVGRIRRVLRDIGRAENTILILTSDNGPFEATGASPGRFTGYKRGMGEGSHRVPGLLEWPARVQSNVQIDEITSIVDLYSTFRDLFEMESHISGSGQDSNTSLPSPNLDSTTSNRTSLALPSERPTDGESLLPLLLNPHPWEWARTQGLGFCLPKYLPTEKACALFAYRWKNWSITGPRQSRISMYSSSTLSLFDLNQDPKEENDLAKSRPDIFEPLMTLAVDWVTNVTSEYFRNCPGAV